MYLLCSSCVRVLTHIKNIETNLLKYPNTAILAIDLVHFLPLYIDFNYQQPFPDAINVLATQRFYYPATELKNCVL